MSSTDDFSLAYALLRATLGVNITMHGISRIPGGIGVFTAALEKQFGATPLPHFAARAFGSALPWAEALVGLLILVGGAIFMMRCSENPTYSQTWFIAGIQRLVSNWPMCSGKVSARPSSVRNGGRKQRSKH